MQTLKHVFAAAAVLGAGIVASTNFAEAQDYVGGYACVPPPPTDQYIYPSASWEPFFRHHYYRYGPTLVCSPSIVTTRVISVLS